MEMRKQASKATHCEVEFCTVDLTAKEISPIFGRDDEIDRMIEILSRQKKNNPLIVGDAGVGKTSIVEGLASRIAKGDVPERLLDKKVLSLDVALLASDLSSIAGIMSSLIKEKAILFIDEIHNIVGAGKTHGSLDLSNILKPLLTDGSITCIGATTEHEYRKFFANDSALDRRFSKINITEPSEEATLQMLKNLAPTLEEHHRVHLTQEAIKSSVDLSVKYLKSRKLPDKAIDLLDEACSRVSVRANKKQLLLKRIEDAKAIGDLETVSRLLYGRIPECQNDSNDVTENEIAQILSNKTGIPITRMTSDDRERLLKIESFLKQRVIGQDLVLETVGDSVRATRTGLKSSVNSFIFLGSSGVGKTETAKALADFLFDSKDAFIRINMSEFQEKNSVNNLIGSPSGYVGYDEGGRLTNAVQKTPHCVILLDEIEKAHDDVFDILLQVLDEGSLTDNKGVEVDMQNSIIIMTSNLSEEKLRERYRDELIGRIDSVVTFNPLSKNLVRQIARKKVEELSEKVKAGNNFTFVLDKKLFQYIVDNSFSAEYGAREIDSLLERLVMKPLSKIILEGIEEDTMIVLKG